MNGYRSAVEALERKKDSGRMGHILQKSELLALAVQGLEAKKSVNLQKSTRQSPEKRQTQRYTTLEELNAVLKNMALNKVVFQWD